MKDDETEGEREIIGGLLKDMGYKLEPYFHALSIYTVRNRLDDILTDDPLYYEIDSILDT